MKDKATKKDTDGNPPAGPIRHGSVLYRMLEVIAAAIAGQLRDEIGGVAARTRDGAPKEDHHRVHTDSEGFITDSASRLVVVKEAGEQHVREDIGFIPSFSD
jgi:hypothetical protein